MGRHHRRGFTKRELIVVLVVIIVLVVLAIPAYLDMGSQALVMTDGAQLRGIHQSWLIYSREFDGKFPMPSKIVRQELMDFGDGETVPDVWKDQSHHDTTAKLFSVVIMHNYLSPEICVGRTEPSSHVTVDNDYNWDAYQPNDNVFWDSRFTADLDGVSNVSYAHMPLFGKRLQQEWGGSLNGLFPVLGNRGPRDGDDPDSITYRIYKPHDAWIGNIIYNDNHIEWDSQMISGQIQIGDQLMPDHIFRLDDPIDHADAILSFTREMKKDGPVLQWD